MDKIFDFLYRKHRTIDYPKYMYFRLIAAVVSGGRILSVGVNKSKKNGYVARNQYAEYCNTHAEIDALLKIKDPKVLLGAKLFVMRLQRDRETIVSAKPCEMCYKAMLDAGIKRVYYTNEHGDVESFRISADAVYVSA